MRSGPFAARVLQLEGPAEIAKEIARTGCEPEGVGIMTRKGSLVVIAVPDVPLKAAPLLKQEMLAVGADSAHHKEVASLKVEVTDVVLLATPSQYARLLPKLRRQPFRLSQLAASVDAALTNYGARRKRSLSFAHGRSLTVGAKTLVMGVLNVTPDSFSDGGHYLDPEQAVRRAKEMVQEGADLIDVGGESTRPDARPVRPAEESRRVIPVLKRLARECDTVLSVDTRNPSVAREALRAGAHLINDVTGLASPEMRRVVGRAGAGAVVMHMRGTPAKMQEDTEYDDLRGEVYAFLKERTDLAQTEGIGAEQLLVDPGLGFGKSFSGNLELLRHAGEFRSLGFPVLIGASRKSFLGALTGTHTPSERVETSVAAALVASLRGAELVRVHDVAPSVKALAVADAIRGTK